MSPRFGAFPTLPYEVTENIPGRPCSRTSWAPITPAPNPNAERFNLAMRPQGRRRVHNAEV